MRVEMSPKDYKTIPIGLNQENSRKDDVLEKYQTKLNTNQRHKMQT